MPLDIEIWFKKLVKNFKGLGTLSGFTHLLIQKSMINSFLNQGLTILLFIKLFFQMNYLMQEPKNHKDRKMTHFLLGLLLKLLQIKFKQFLESNKTHSLRRQNDTRIGISVMLQRQAPKLQQQRSQYKNHHSKRANQKLIY